jgi:site-specific DNA-methyltransferase (cytosine-N4-specific)
MGIEEWINRIHCGDAYKLLKLMPSESVDCVITSPPYYGLRVYGGKEVETIFGGNQACEHEWKDGFCIKCGAWKGQLGLEPDWRMYVEHLVELFREVKRVLKKTGSLWLNIGDTYASKPTGSMGRSGWKRPHGRDQSIEARRIRGNVDYPSKCLMGIPWRVAFALIDDGWILRNAVIWYKPNHMPSSVKDRLTQTYEYIFHFVKSRKYYYNLDNIREPHKVESFERWDRALRQTVDSNAKLRRKTLETTGVTVACMVPKWYELAKHDLAVGRIGNFSYTDPLHVKAYNMKGKNPGDFFSIPTKPFKGSHFAVFPPELPLRPILASCPPDGIVLDPLAGSGTVAYTCELINRGMWDEFRIPVNDIAKSVKWNLKWIMIDINPEYCKMMEERLEPFIKQKSLDEVFRRT